LLRRAHDILTMAKKTHLTTDFAGGERKKETRTAQFSEISTASSARVGQLPLTTVAAECRTKLDLNEIV
jgi:hypothetical protein